MRMSKSKMLGAVSVATVALLALTACGKPPAETSATNATANNSNFLACMVSDEGGFDDRSFNQLAHDGLVEAKEQLGVKTAEAQSSSSDDFAPNLNAMVEQGCNIIIPVGFMLADATQAVADKNPDTHFAIVDVDYLKGSNLLQLNYDTAQAAFLAGYASAGQSKSGKVATFGGSKIPSVTIFMDGFALGVQYYNQQKGTNVQVLGWDVAGQEGDFVGDFTNQTKANQITQGFLAQGADIILPVGGPLYQGAAEAIRDDGNKALILGVDSDLREKEPDYSDIIFVSIEKGLDVTVLDAIRSAVDGKFQGGTTYTGTLKNKGVGLSGFGDFESKLPAGMTDELETIKQGIIDGTIKVDSPSSPKVSE